MFYVDLNQKQIKISDVKNPTEDEAWVWTYTTDGIKLQDERIKFFQVADYLNGWIEEDGNWYLYSNNEKLTGWQMSNGNWYYLNEKGIMLTGWILDNGNKYYLRSSGAMATGWVQDGGKWYFLESNGAMATNKWINGIYYVKSNGEMAVNEWVDGGRYYVGVDGKWIPNKTK